MNRTLMFHDTMCKPSITTVMTVGEAHTDYQLQVTTPPLHHDYGASETIVSCPIMERALLKYNSIHVCVC